MATSDNVGAIASLVITGASGIFTGKILSLDVGRSIPVINRTPLDRTSGGMTYDKGRLASFTMSGTMIFTPSGGLPLGTKGQTRLTMADAGASVYTWSTGFLSEMQVGIQHEQEMDASFTLTLNGDYTVS